MTDYTEFFNTELKIDRKETGNTGGRSYKYASLSETFSEIKALLRENNMHMVEKMDYVNDEQIYSVSIFSGDKVVNKCTILMPTMRDMFEDQKNNKPIQTYGMVITYIRRYVSTVVMGAIAEEDNDGNYDRSTPIAKGKLQGIKQVKNGYTEYTDEQKKEAELLLKDLDEVKPEKTEEARKAMASVNFNVWKNKINNTINLSS